MIIAARDAGWGGDKAHTAKDYVQDGLVAMWDGIENAGWGMHDPSATVWKDLSGNGHDMSAYRSGYAPLKEWQDNCAVFRRQSYVGFSTYKYGSTDIDLPFEMPKSISLVCAWDDAETLSGAIGFGLVGQQYSYQIFKNHKSSSGGTIQGNDTTSFSLGVGDVMNISVNIGADAFKNGISFGKAPKMRSGIYGNPNAFIIGALIDGSFNYQMYGRIFNIRLYSRALTAEEIAHNYKIDKARFGL